MATTTYDFEGGSAGAAATTANSGASAISTTGGGAVTFQSARAASGNFGLQFVAGTTNIVTADFTSFTTSTQEEIRFVIDLPAGGFSADTTILQLYGSTDGTTTIGRLHVNGNILQFSDLGVAHNGTVLADISAYFGTKVAMHLVLDTGTTTSNGIVKIRMHASPTDVAGTFVGSEFSVSNYNIGSDGTGRPIMKVRFGFGTVQTVTKTLGIDYVQINSGSTAFAFNGPAAAGAPTANAGADLYPQRDEVVNCTSTGSSAGAGTLTYLWTATHSEGASVTIATPTASTTNISTAVAGQVTVTLRVTQTDAQTATDTAILYVRPKIGEDVLVFAIDTVGQVYTNEGGAASTKAALNDSLTTTFSESPDAPSGALLGVWYQPMGLGAITLYPLTEAFGGAITTVTDSLYTSKGGTLIDSWTYTPAVGTFNEPLDGGTPGFKVDITILTDLASRKQLYHTTTATA